MAMVAPAFAPLRVQSKSKRVSWGFVDTVETFDIEEDDVVDVAALASHLKKEAFYPSLLSSRAFAQAVSRPPPGLDICIENVPLKVPLPWDCQQHGGNWAMPRNFVHYGFAPPTLPQNSSPSLLLNRVVPPSAQETPPTADHGAHVPEHEYTTIMLKNIPKHVHRGMILEMLEKLSLNGHFDFVYLPCDFKSGLNLGYGFVNFITHELAERAFELCEGYSEWEGCESCEVTWRNKHQGLESNIENIRNTTVMHHLVPDELKPLLFKDGAMADFPAPTKPIPMPKKLLGALSAPIL
jgi:hypothetical protein